MAQNDLDEQYRVQLKAALEEGGAPKVVAFIQNAPDAELRRNLYSLVRRAFPERNEGAKNFDDLIFVTRAGIAEAFRQAELARARVDLELANECKDSANRLSYNLAADLAECWPGDEAPRERRHLESGFRAACDCIVWRQELGKPPDRRAMAYWAAGMHQLSLGNPIEALGWFETAAGLAAKAIGSKAETAGEAGGPTDGVGTPEAGGLNAADYVKPGGDFGVILYHGYAGIARHLLKNPDGMHQYKRACLSFQGTINNFKDPEMVEDARFGLEQLQWVERRFMSAEKEGGGAK
jgi:hypothetical protein